MITNIPAPIASAIKSNDFVPVNSGYSASRISMPVQIHHLRQISNAKEEVIDNIWMLIRSGMLHIIEQNDESSKVYRGAQAVFNAMKKRMLVEKSINPDGEAVKKLKETMDFIASFARTNYPIDQSDWILKQTYSRPVTVELSSSSGDRKVQETRDVFDTIHMYDKKEKKLYLMEIVDPVIYAKPKSRIHLDNKASIQAYILEYNGFEVKEAQAVMVFKNFLPYKSELNEAYPKHPMEMMPLRILKTEHVERLVKDRISKYIMYEKGYVSPCSPEDRWKKADEYCIVRRNGKIADGARYGFLTPEAAQEKINANMKLYSGCYVDLKVGESTRCEKWCKVNHICPQWAEIKVKQNERAARLEQERRDRE